MLKTFFMSFHFFLKKVFSIFCNSKWMLFVFIAFPTAMGIATFIENDYGTQTAKALIYNALWFELLMFFLGVIFVANIFKYRLYQKKKWAVLLFHIAFLLILIGAFITRSFGKEGIIVIKEGESKDIYISEKTYLQAIIDNNKEQKYLKTPVLFSAKGKNNYTLKTDFRGQKVVIKLLDYIPNAKAVFEPQNKGQVFLHFVESSTGKRKDHYIKKGTLKNIKGLLIGFEAPENATIHFSQKNDTLKMYSILEGNFLRMADKLQGKIQKEKSNPLQYLTLHNIGGLNFVIPEKPRKGNFKYHPSKENEKEDVLILQIKSKSEKKIIHVKGGQYTTNAPVKFSLADLNFRILYGAKELKLPFKIKLRDFQLKKYPGSESASSYASEVSVQDFDSQRFFDYKIYMNHILEYKGYRFFQSSYDITPQYEETRLSVNYDAWGTKVTYFGYCMLFFWMLSIFFLKNTRFYYLKKQLKKVRTQKKAFLILIFCIVNFYKTNAQQKIPTHDHEHKNHETAHPNKPPENQKVQRLKNYQIDSIFKKIMVSKKHAAKFSTLVIQDEGGRMKPVHTFASELLRKVRKKDTYKNFNASQMLLSIIQKPFLWYEVPIIYLEKNSRKNLCKILEIPTKKYAALFDFIDFQGNYKIRELVAAAQKKQIKSNFEKDLIQIDKRIGLLYSAISGAVFRMFPIPNSPENKWIAPTNHTEFSFKGIDSVFVKQIFPLYVQTIVNAKKNNNYQDVEQLLEGIRNFQKKHGKNIYPSEKKIQLEILYNKYDVFKKLFSYDLYVSLLLFVFVIWQIFKPKKWIFYTIKILIGGVVFLFVLHTLGLIFRGFISQHAPWSNAYESIIYVAWATLFFGLVFGRKSSLTIAATTFLTAIILMVAHWNWMDPQIANLPPVLNSYWLMIHVAVIVASYGPFALSMILGMINVLLYIFTTKSSQKKMNLHIKELTIINEMSMTVGLAMLTIGNFLGAMWANESWGRYWGWDPKETWALISIMVYALVLHVRLIPKLKGRFLFNVLSVYAFASIMMTYFGVNFYLSGKHSYAQGEQIVTPSFVYWTVGIVSFFVFLAMLKNKILNNEKTKI